MCMCVCNNCTDIDNSINSVAVVVIRAIAIMIVAIIIITTAHNSSLCLN